MRNDLMSKSKFLSLVLRHRPQEIGLKLDESDWADVIELLQKANLDFVTLQEIVDTNDKKRFAFNQNKTKIRASQGHSLKDVDLKLEEKVPPDFLYHGTADRFLPSILKQGLVKGQRQYVHLSLDESMARKVGQRHGKPVLLKICCQTMVTDGFKFYLSDNGVWLVDNVPSRYIKTEAH